jgi:hypothetical protein
MEPRVLKFALAVVAALSFGFGTQHGLTQRTGSTPFSVSIVPAWSGPSGGGISMASDVIDSFYVVLTNTSHRSEAAFEPWNSWGYYSISFEVITGAGKVIKIAKGPQLFTKNTPVTFLIPPGEQKVFPIKLNDDWDATPALPIADETPTLVTIKAIYEIGPTPESSAQKVWIGHVESRSYRFGFRHWASKPSTQDCP